MAYFQLQRNWFSDVLRPAGLQKPGVRWRQLEAGSCVSWRADDMTWIKTNFLQLWMVCYPKHPKTTPKMTILVVKVMRVFVWNHNSSLKVGEPESAGCDAVFGRHTQKSPEKPEKSRSCLLGSHAICSLFSLPSSSCQHLLKQRSNGCMSQSLNRP